MHACGRFMQARAGCGVRDTYLGGRLRHMYVCVLGRSQYYAPGRGAAGGEARARAALLFVLLVSLSSINRSAVRAARTTWNFAESGLLAVPGGRMWYGVVGERRGGGAGL